MRKRRAAAVITPKKAIVCVRSESASFFFPSTYNCAGLPKIKKPVTAAESTKRRRSAIGTKMVFVLPILTRVPKYINNPTAVIYSETEMAFINAFFVISFIPVFYQTLSIFPKMYNRCNIFKMTKKRNVFITGSFIIFLGLSLLFIVFIFPNEQKLAGQLPGQLQKQDVKFSVHYVKIKDISPLIQKAAIASQDRRFYNNWGIDLVGTARAIYMTVVTGKRQGASTIPEQLAKNAFLADKDTLTTDVQSKLLAPFITFGYPKQYILEMYLNGIYFGRNAYGIYNASQTYFHTTPDKVTLSQAAYLIGLINAPSYLANHNKDAIYQAQLVLDEMKKNNYISDSQEQVAEKSLQSL
jgi:Transglycosylase